MSCLKSASLCRICLENNGIIPIFENKENVGSIYSKLCLGLGETILDIPGYPRNICNLCQITLNTVYNFVKQYKKSSQTLLDTVNIVKQEDSINIIKQKDVVVIDSSDNENCDPVVKIVPKIEFNNAQVFAELLKPIKKKLSKLKTELHIKKDKKKRKIKTEGKTLNFEAKRGFSKSNRIAASILEGEFTWHGEQWRTLSSIHEKPEPKQNKQETTPPAFKPTKKKENPKPEARLCDLCGKVFRNERNLRTHYLKEHEHVTITCPQCPKTFTSNSYLSRHVFRVHNLKAKNYICSACGKAFCYQGDMDKHYKIVHLNMKHLKKKYACKLCDKKYSASKSLVIHERAVHTGDRPAECHVCGNRFYHEDYLREHMRLHTGEAPFKCPICGRGYAQRCNMKSHVKHNHRLSQLDPMTLSTIKPYLLKCMKS